MRSASTRHTAALIPPAVADDSDLLRLWLIMLEERQLTDSFLEVMPLPVAQVCDAGGRIAVVAQNAGFRIIAAQHDSQHRSMFDAEIARFLGGSDFTRDFDWQDRDDLRARYFRVRLARLPDHRSGPRCLASLVERTTEINTARSLRAEMLHDSLTGLPNRTAFIETVADALAASPDEPGHTFAVLVVDLNRFSRINECMGSIAGDELIITVARRLLSTLRAGDLLARIGGDEFAVLLGIRDAQSDAINAARRIRAELAAPFRLSELEIGISCAIGIAFASEAVSDAEDIVRNAQFALKRGKITGQAEVYSSSEVSAVRRRFSVETELRRAIEGGKLTLAFQPLIDLATGAVSGFEALTRWEDEQRGAISPAEFIPVAEESGLILPLGRWVLDEALRTVAAWDAAVGRPVGCHVAVNISAIQLARDDVARFTAEALDRFGVAGNRLTLELTESLIVDDPARATRVLGALKDLGATIAMDDFGTGHSNLAYLQKLPIDMLKIDRSFVTGMLADRDKVAIVRAILGLADALGMTTTAEGVETVELAQTLAALGCTFGQGHYYAAPLTGDAALAYALSRGA